MPSLAHMYTNACIYQGMTGSVYMYLLMHNQEYLKIKIKEIKLKKLN